jgi:hypothetical protein
MERQLTFIDVDENRLELWLKPEATRARTTSGSRSRSWHVTCAGVFHVLTE